MCENDDAGLIRKQPRIIWRLPSPSSATIGPSSSIVTVTTRENQPRVEANVIMIETKISSKWHHIDNAKIPQWVILSEEASVDTSSCVWRLHLCTTKARITFISHNFHAIDLKSITYSLLLQITVYRMLIQVEIEHRWKVLYTSWANQKFFWAW